MDKSRGKEEKWKKKPKTDETEIKAKNESKKNP
jgi:hypothetical protein